MEENNLRNIKKDISVVGWSLAAFTLVSYAAANIIYLVFCELMPDIANTTLFQLVVGTLPIYLIGLPLILLITRRLPYAEVNEKQKLSLGKFFCILLLCFGAMYISSFISVAINNAIGKLKGSAVTTSTTQIVGSSSLWARMVFVSLVGPIMEEIIFRKIILFKLLRYGEFISIFFSALAFGLFHGNITQLLYAFSIGIILAYVTVKTGTIKYSIIMHIIINTFGSIIIPLMSTMGSSVILVMATACIGMFVLLCIVFAIVYFAVNYRKINFREGCIQLTTSEKWKVMIFNVGTIVFLLISVISIVIETIF